MTYLRLLIATKLYKDITALKVLCISQGSTETWAFSFVSPRPSFHLSSCLFNVLCLIALYRVWPLILRSPELRNSNIFPRLALTLLLSEFILLVRAFHGRFPSRQNISTVTASECFHWNARKDIWPNRERRKSEARPSLQYEWGLKRWSESWPYIALNLHPPKNIRT